MIYRETRPLEKSGYFLKKKKLCPIYNYNYIIYNKIAFCLEVDFWKRTNLNDVVFIHLNHVVFIHLDHVVFIHLDHVVFIHLDITFAMTAFKVFLVFSVIVSNYVPELLYGKHSQYGSTSWPEIFFKNGPGKENKWHLKFDFFPLA